MKRTEMDDAVVRAVVLIREAKNILANQTRLTHVEDTTIIWEAREKLQELAVGLERDFAVFG